MDSKKIRRDNLELLIQKFGKVVRFAEFVETDNTYLSQILNPDKKANLGDALARKIEKKFKLKRGWMDVTHGESNQLSPENLVKIIPILEWNEIDRRGKITNEEARQVLAYYFPGAGTDIYALQINNDAMLTTFTHLKSLHINEYIIIDPDLEPQNGNYVIAIFKDHKEGIVRQYITEGGEVFLKALNPQYSPIKVSNHIKISGVVIGSINHLINLPTDELSLSPIV